jgi:hypothetical protein
MIRKDFPCLDTDPAGWRNRPAPDSIGCPALAAVGRIVSGHSFHDDETGDADTGGLWFARIDLPKGGTVANLFAHALEMEPDSDELAGVDPPAWACAGIIYGRDSDGFDIVGAWTDPDGFGRAWNRLSGAWAEPDSGFALRKAENESRHRVRLGHGFRVELAEGFRTTSVAFRIVHDTGADRLIQSEHDRPAVASAFGWVPRGPLGCPCHAGTDGTEDCGECGKTTADFTEEASAYIADLCGSGIRAEDPGYF